MYDRDGFVPPKITVIVASALELGGLVVVALGLPRLPELLDVHQGRREPENMCCCCVSWGPLAPLAPALFDWVVKVKADW